MERCGAKTRAGTPCQRPPYFNENGRCCLHGGCSTGPRTPEGKARSAANGRLGGRPRKPAGNNSERAVPLESQPLNGNQSPCNSKVTTRLSIQDAWLAACRARGLIQCVACAHQLEGYCDRYRKKVPIKNPLQLRECGEFADQDPV